MKKILPYCIITGIIVVFFYKTLFFGKIPFPGDLLLSTYAPWRHVSYFGYVAGSVPSKDQYFDVIRELYPWKTEVLRQIKDKTAPLWNPYNFSGSPLLANYQSQVFYPPGVLYMLLPQITALTILIILQPILGGIFMYLFASTIGISSIGAIIAAVAFNFSSFANIWMEFDTVWHTILWLPLLLYVSEKGVQNKKITFGQQLLFMFALFSSITGGHPQDFIHVFLFFLLYLITRITLSKNWSRRDKLSFALCPLSIIIFIPFLLTAPQLLPTVELYTHSARVPHDYQYVIKMLFTPWQLGLIAVQEFFGNPATRTNFLSNTYIGKAISIGVVGFFLSLFSFGLWKRSWHVTFFIIASFGLLLYTTDTPLSQIFYRFPTPILSTGTPTRILFLFCFSLSILAGFGFDQLWKIKKNLWKPIGSIGIIMALLWVFAFFHPTLPGITYTQSSFQTMKKAMLISSAFIGLSLVCIVAGKWKKIAQYGFVGLVCLELLYGFTKFNPFVPKEFIFPDNPLITFFQSIGGIDRLWGYGTARIEANFATQYRFFSPDGTDPLNLKWYNEFIQASRDGNIERTFSRMTRSDAQLIPGYGVRDLPDNPFRLRVMDSLGVKYVIDRSENPKDDTTFPKDRFKEIWRQNDWIVYENIYSAPRYFLTSAYLTYDTTQEFEQQFFSSLFDPRSMVLLSKKDASHLPQLVKGSGSVTLLSYKPNTVIFETKAESPQLLYISDTYDYGWNATIDGVRTPLYRANYAFRAVVVPGGTHRIIFSYQPSSFTRGIRMALVGISVLIVYSLWQYKSVKKLKNKKVN